MRRFQTAGDRPAPAEVLLVEDDESHAELILRAFEAYRDSFGLTLVASLEAAAAAIRKTSNFALVIADWFLPDGGALRLLEEQNRLPLLIMTSEGNDQMAVTAMKSGALDYVVKSQHTFADMPNIAGRAIRHWETILARERAENQLKAALLEKETLVKEIHHRVKNNLQVVCSLLNLQIQQASKDSIVNPLRQALNRAQAMSLVHEQLYQSPSLSDLDLTQYLERLSRHLFEAYCVDSARVRMNLNIERVPIAMGEAVPCGLILNELCRTA